MFPQKIRKSYNGLIDVIIDETDIKEINENVNMPCGYVPHGLIYCQNKPTQVGLYRWNGEYYVLIRTFLPKLKK